MACSEQENLSGTIQESTERETVKIRANEGNSMLAYVKHDSLWYTDLTLNEALELGISEQCYNDMLNNLEAMNCTLKDAYLSGRKVVFAENDVDSALTKSIERETYATATIDGNCNNSAYALFFTHERTIALVVSSSSGSWPLNINNQTVTGFNGQRATITHMDGSNMTMTYEWSLFIRSNFMVVAPAWIQIVFLKVNA